jgi:hypothetical protein
MHASEEKAIRAILKSEESRSIYYNICEIMGKFNTPLAQVDVLSTPNNPSSPHTTLTCREDIEMQILCRNRKHSMQSLSTQLDFSRLIDPLNQTHAFDEILDGTIDTTTDDFAHLNDNEKAWIQSLQQLVKDEISLSLSLDDFKNYFNSKQEQRHHPHLAVTWAIIRSPLNAYDMKIMFFQNLWSPSHIFPLYLPPSCLDGTKLPR